MKPLLTLLGLCCAVFLSAAGPENLLKEPLTITNPRTTVCKDGVYFITNPDTKTISSLVQTVTLNQTKPGPITFSIQAKAMENVGNHGCYFGVVVNLVYTDGTKTGGINFGMGSDTFDWRAGQRTYHPKKPVKTATFVAQYMRSKGKVAFRNPQLINGVPKANTAAAARASGIPVPYDKLGKFKITHKDRNLETELVRNGRSVAAIVGAPELARVVNAAIQSKTGVTLPVLPHTAYENAEKLDRNLIIIGSRDDNRTMSNFYNRHFALIDGKYPGPGGYDVHSVHNPLGDKFNLILAGGSNVQGHQKAVARLAERIRKCNAGKSLELGFISDAKLSPSYKVARDVKDIPLWEHSTGYGSRGVFSWNSLARNLAMLYITNDPYYKNEFMRLAFPKDKKTQRELFLRDDEAYHDDPSEPIVKVYHYRGQYMTLYWDMVDENPLFTDEERLKVNQKLYEQLVFRLTRKDYTNPYRNYNTRKLVRPDRHYCWEVLTAYTTARFLDKDFPCFDTKEGLRLGRNAMEPLYEKPLIGNIALFWVVTSAELQTYYAALQGHRLVGNPVLKEYAKNLTLISTLGKGSDDRNAIYGSSWVYLALSYLAQDEGVAMLARNRAQGGNFASKIFHDHSIFRVGQSFWPSAKYPQDSVKDNVGKWIEFATAIPKDPRKSEVLFTSYRSKGDASGDYMMVDPHYSTGLRDPQHNFAMLFAILDGVPLLYGYENALVPYANGLNIGKYPFDAEIISRGAKDQFSWITGRIRNFNGFDCDRTWLMREGKYLAAIDRITARQDHAAARFDLKYTAGHSGSAKPLADGDFQSGVYFNGRDHQFIWSFSDDAPVLSGTRSWGSYLPGDAVVFQPFKSDLKKGDTASYVTIFRPGNALDTRTSARDGDRVALRTPAPVLITLSADGFTLEGADKTFTMNGTDVTITEGRASAAAEAMAILKKRPRKPFTPPAIADAPQLQNARWVAHLAHAPGRISVYGDEAAITAGNTLTVVNTISGKTVFRAELDAPVYSVAYHPEAKLWLAGAKNEILTAYDARGKVQWTFKSEMHAKAHNLGPYWHKSALPGVRSLFVHKGKIFIGSATTMEVVDTKGKLLAREYVRYGAMDEQFLNPVTGTIMLIRPSGGAGLMDIDPDTYKIKAHDHWSLGKADNLNTYGFNQVNQYQVIFFKDAKGQYQAANLLSGAQNRFIIRNGKGKTLFEANFGPGRAGHNVQIPTRHSRTLRAMAMADLDGDGKQEFAVTHANGSFYIFDDQANVKNLYTIHPMVRSLASDGKAFYAGLTDGRILKIDQEGVRTIARVKGDIYLLQVLPNGHLLAGSNTGDVTLF